MLDPTTTTTAEPEYYLEDSSSDDDDYEYYDYTLEDPPIDWSEGAPSLTVYGLTFVVGVVGNVLILVSVARHTHVKHSPVNVFLASLATADLMLVLVCLPLKVILCL